MTGINRVLLNIVKYIPQFDNVNKYYLYTYDDPPIKNNYYTYITTIKNKLPRQIYEHYWLNFILPDFLSKQNIDLFFTPYVLVPLKKGKYKNVIVIHDVMTKACKEHYSFHYRKYMDMIVPLAIKRSDAIVTVSESSMKDIIKYYNVPEEKVHCMHLWTDEKYKPINFSEEEKKLLQKKYNLPKKFILFVGAIEQRKNISGLLKISDILKSKGINISFVLVGSAGFGFKQLQKEITARKERITYLNYVDEGDIPYIYNLTSIFIFPSHYEGFGLPVLEAMKCGTPVLTSDNSSLPEVVGEGGLLCNADDVDSFVENIKLLLWNKEFYNSMGNKARKQAEKFTPELQLHKLIDVFNRIM